MVKLDNAYYNGSTGCLVFKNFLYIMVGCIYFSSISVASKLVILISDFGDGWVGSFGGLACVGSHTGIVAGSVLSFYAPGSNAERLSWSHVVYNLTFSLIQK